MRRKDREITDTKEIMGIIEASKVLHLGLFDEGYPYVVPLNYGFEYNNNSFVFYLHSANEGHKLNLIQDNNKACIEIETNIEPISGGDLPCKYGCCFSSVIARGSIEILNNPKDKIHALENIMRHQTGRDFEINEIMAQSVTVLKFTAENLTAKARKKPS